ncbi:MAG: SDR family NAD(P)-dependent oxidoreductase [Sphingomonadales bacterium]|jgi:NAD(P)-dependent dehydrogenase (short-subunit alcohol dehydrogenase family)
MSKTILITGATDGIGFETAKVLRASGHSVLLHGRSAAKLDAARAAVAAVDGDGRIATYQADLSSIAATRRLADEIRRAEPDLDVLINNAGVFSIAKPMTEDRLDVRFVVNTVAPYVLARELAFHIGMGGRIVNLSSAAQAPVSLAALAGEERLSDNDVYAQSKLALTMWSRHMADEFADAGPAVIAVNPARSSAARWSRKPMEWTARTSASGPTSCGGRPFHRSSTMPRAAILTMTAASFAIRTPMRSTRR